MLHPFFRNKLSSLMYLLAWIMLVVIHVFVLNTYYGLRVQYAIYDGIIIYGLYLILGIGLWYPVRFVYLSDINAPSKVLNLLGIGAGTIILWQVLGSSVLRVIISDESEFSEYLRQSVPLKLIAGSLIFMILALVYFLIMYFTTLEERKLAEANLKSLVKESELNLLKYKLNPHFLFNSLNSISSLTLIDPENAQEMIVKLSDYLRYSLESDQQQFRELKDELDNVRLYFDIEKTRFGDRIQFSEKTDELCLNCKVPGMILQPLLENAIKHGVHESTEPIAIELECKLEEGALILVLRNDYTQGVKRIKGTGTGLENVKKRLSAIYNRDDLVRISKKDFIFEVRLIIPVISDPVNVEKS